ncbi:MAG: hypothetical protein P8181_03745 [bacterium]
MARNHQNTPAATGGFTSIDGEAYYRISAYDRMPPFLMSVASDTDIWMYITSRGGLTAGRVDADGSLFPYETADKLHDGHHSTGPITLLRVRRHAKPPVLWEPFSYRDNEGFQIDRNLYKNTIGNRIIFEETNHDLGLTFRYRWSGCDEFGLVRTGTVVNRTATPVSIELLDGLRNVLPYGVPLALYQQMSSLVDAYKRIDCDPDTQLGIFSLTSRIIDRAEAAEELRANIVWCCGLSDFNIRLSAGTVGAFRRGEPLTTETVLTGRRGNYFAVSSFEAAPEVPVNWHLAADVGRDHIQIAAIRARLANGEGMVAEIDDCLQNAGENLRRNVGSADGLQLTGHPEADAHHFANVLFNNMRGGVFAKNYDVPTADLKDFLRHRNREVAERYSAHLDKLPGWAPLTELIADARSTGDADYQRLIYEYLPIYFARRHGDPSRPWNRFAIRVKTPDGGRAFHYEGNWRDIFQNWEALCASFPGFLPNVIAKFVNASTVDGFNPYRITRDGIDWEVAAPDDPWSTIGYWGDHQIVYLLRFLEAFHRTSASSSRESAFQDPIEDLLKREIFCYADVPYRLKTYESIIANPHLTIDYDRDLASRIDSRVSVIGSDGKLLPGKDGPVYHVNLLEKLIVPVLSKLSNLVLDGGIWMNTQRPEWNDANNALVGHGISMVTLCYLRRYLNFLSRLLDGIPDEPLAVSREVHEWYAEVRSILDKNRALLSNRTIDDRDRKLVLDTLGTAFSKYREKVYSSGFSGKTTVSTSEVSDFCRGATEYLDHAIRANRRADGLYHAYNLLEITDDLKGISVRSLYEMLEGQVAVLSSGAIGAAEAVRLLTSLFESRMYRNDQRSFLLYPERELPGFLEKNVIPDETARAMPLLRELIDAEEHSIVARDALGVIRFNADFRNSSDLDRALDRLARTNRWAGMVTDDRQAVLDVFEDVFNHKSFTGRSGTMYGYEGLGCIYWHMVSKLLLAVQEIVLRAADDGEPAQVVEALGGFYHRIRSGLGFEKTAAEYGAFPTDPYSHTPAHAGAQQPGMTGQVKEEILTRFGELGLRVDAGSIRFRPVLLTCRDFREDAGIYRFYDLEGSPQSINVPAGGLAFSFCQVPVVYELTGDVARIRIVTHDGTSSMLSGEMLDTLHSQAFFERTGEMSRIEVGIPSSWLFEFPGPAMRRQDGLRNSAPEP